jgi:hypothetical protein
VSERTEYATAKDTDVAKIRELFDAGIALTKEIARERYIIPDRRFRAAVAALRAEGYPCVSWSSEGSTYRKARDIAELDAFIDGELLPRIRKLEREARAMRTFGRDYYRTTQPTLGFGVR